MVIFHSYVTVYQRVRCKISNFPLCQVAGSDTSLESTSSNAWQTSSGCDSCRFQQVGRPQNSDVFWVDLVWSPAKIYIYIWHVLYIYLFMYLFIYLFIIYLLIYLFIYLFYIHRKKQLYKLRGIDGSWTWLKETCATSKTSICLGVKSMPSTCVQKTAIRWMVCFWGLIQSYCPKSP